MTPGWVSIPRREVVLEHPYLPISSGVFHTGTTALPEVARGDCSQTLAQQGQAIETDDTEDAFKTRIKLLAPILPAPIFPSADLVRANLSRGRSGAQNC
jgi:hypothetical protein